MQTLHESAALKPCERVEADTPLSDGVFGIADWLCVFAGQGGRRVVMIGPRAPARFAIGKSRLRWRTCYWKNWPTAMDCLESGPFSKWGTWQRERPGRCGWAQARLHVLLPSICRKPFADEPRSRQRGLLVAASPHDEIVQHPLVQTRFQSCARSGGRSCRNDLS